MGEGYWDLFWATGAPEFYLLQKRGGGTRQPGQEENGTVTQTPQALA